MKSLLALILILVFIVECLSQQQQQDNNEDETEKRADLEPNMQQSVNAFNFVRRYFKNRETLIIKKMIEIWRKNGNQFTWGKKKQPDRLIGR